MRAAIALRKISPTTSIIAAILIGPVAVAQDQSCIADDNTIAHFRRLAVAESLAEAPLGLAPISKETAAKIAHFRIATDGCGAITTIGYFHGDSPKPLDENFTGNFLTQSSQAVFHHEGPQTTIRFFDHALNGAAAPDEIDHITITRDQQGRPVEASFYNNENTLTNSASGYALAKWRWLSDDAAIETRYNSKGALIVSGNSFKFSSAHLELGDHGLLKELTVDAENTTIDFERNADSSLKGWRALDAMGNAISIAPSNTHGADYGYDQHGYLVRMKYLDESEVLTMSAFGHMGFTRDYADNGNRLSYHFVNASEEKWAPPARGYAGQHYTWRDDDLVRIRTEYRDVNGALINHPQRNYAVIAYDFDDRDYPVRRTFFDAAGNPLYAQTP